MSPLRTLVVLGVVAAIAAPASAQSPVSLQAAVDLYASAAYDDALRMFDALRTRELDAPAVAQVEQHRMLCLVALGETSAAEAAAAALVDAAPTLTLDASEVPPRVRTLFDTTRRRLLPALARQRYAEAKRAYDTGDYATARDGFEGLVELLATDVTAADPTLADRRTLTEGFGHLAAAAVERATAARRDLETVRAAMAALRDPEPVATRLGATLPPASAESDVVLVPPPVAVAAAATPAPFSPIDIFTYDWRDKDVTPPTPVEQPISGWWGPMGEPAAGTKLGVVDLVVDEHGRVADAYIHQSVNRVYDAVLLASVKQWSFQPASRGGRPVKYRRLTGVVSQR